MLCIRNAIAEDADYDIILSKWNWRMGGMPLLYFAIVENGLDCNCTLSKIVIFIFIFAFLITLWIALIRYDKKNSPIKMKKYLTKYMWMVFFHDWATSHYFNLMWNFYAPFSTIKVFSSSKMNEFYLSSWFLLLIQMIVN